MSCEDKDYSEWSQNYRDLDSEPKTGIVSFMCDICNQIFSADDEENTSRESRNYCLCKKCYVTKWENQGVKEQEGTGRRRTINDY